MKVSELVEHLSSWDPDLEIQVRITIPEGEEENYVSEIEGEYMQVTDERSLLVEHGKLTIIADWEGFS